MAAAQSAPSGEPPVDTPYAVDLCLLLGRTLFNFGATAQRIQDSVVFLARHLGCRVDMLVSYDALLITVTEGATFRTRIDSAARSAGLDLVGLVRVSQWLRGLAGSRPSPREVEETVLSIRDAPPVSGPGWRSLAAGGAGAAFCIVNGGDPVSWASSFVAAALVYAVRRWLTARRLNPHVTMSAVALAGSLVGGLLARQAHTTTLAVALVAPVLFLVPGVPLINGGIDVVRNHVSIGIARGGFTLAVLVALSLGVGSTLALVPLQIGPPFALPGGWETVLVSLAGALGAGALAGLNNGSGPLVALCALGGLTGRLVRALATLGGLDLVTASLVGVVCSTLLVSLVGHRFRWPGGVASVMAALPMVPGSFAIEGLHSLLAFAAADAADPAQLTHGLQALSRALFVSVALVVGVIGPVTVLAPRSERV